MMMQVTAASTVDPTKCRAKLLSRRGARARSPTLLTLETFDTYGNRVAWGGAAVGCKMWPVDVRSGTAVPVHGADLVQDHLDGTSPTYPSLGWGWANHLTQIKFTHALLIQRPTLLATAERSGAKPVCRCVPVICR